MSNTMTEYQEKALEMAAELGLLDGNGNWNGYVPTLRCDYKRAKTEEMRAHELRVAAVRIVNGEWFNGWERCR